VQPHSLPLLHQQLHLQYLQLLHLVLLLGFDAEQLLLAVARGCGVCWGWCES
jgi:hypothetical protein